MSVRVCTKLNIKRPQKWQIKKAEMAVNKEDREELHTTEFMNLRVLVLPLAKWKETIRIVAGGRCLAEDLYVNYQPIFLYLCAYVCDGIEIK